MVPPTGVSSFPLITTWGMEKLVGSGQGAVRHRMLCLDQVPSLWQEREAVWLANSYPSSHLECKREKRNFNVNHSSQCSLLYAF